MIDTKVIRENLDKAKYGFFEFHNIGIKLCDSHDDLERKLKIAEDALDSVNSISKDFLPCKCNETPCDFCFVKDHVFAALKQIRGE